MYSLILDQVIKKTTIIDNKKLSRYYIITLISPVEYQPRLLFGFECVDGEGESENRRLLAIPTGLVGGVFEATVLLCSTL